jgi:succinoglycan biosynthesis transport protein ExoP
VQVISDAEVPRDPSSPRRLRMLATGMFLGGLIGLMIAALREMRDMPLRAAGDVMMATGLACAGLVPTGVRAGHDGPAERVAQRTADRLRINIDRALPDVATGRIVGVAAVAAGGDTDSVVAVLIRALVARAGRVLVVDAGGMRGGLPRDISRAATADLWTLADLRARLYGPAGRRTDVGALAELRADWPYVIVVMPPLTRAMVAEEMAWMLDAALLTIPWGQVTPALVTGALLDHRAFAERVVSTVLYGADLRSAMRFLDPNSYEAGVMHA